MSCITRRLRNSESNSDATGGNPHTKAKKQTPEEKRRHKLLANLKKTAMTEIAMVATKGKSLKQWFISN